MRLPLRLMSKARSVARSLWFEPLVIALLGIALGVLLPLVDQHPSVVARLDSDWTRILLASTSDGARQLLGTSAGALATILGVAFSLTLVTLQLAAQQYTPRLIGRLMDDPVTKLVLGSYVGTVAYLLLVLRVVHGPSGDLEKFVPWLSITVGIVLILCCLGLLAVFIHHLGHSIQAANVVAGVARNTIARIRRGEARSPEETEPTAPVGAPVHLHAREHGYVRVIDVERIAQVAPRGATFLRIDVAVGDFVLKGQRIAAIWPARPLDDRDVDRARQAFDTGAARTPEQDLLLGVQQISDVALKALSASMNDETTAILAVNELGAIGVELARAGVPAAGYRRADREGLIVVAPAVGMARFMVEAFREVIRSAAGHPRVLGRVHDVLEETAAAARRPDSREVVLEFARAVSAPPPARTSGREAAQGTRVTASPRSNQP